MPRRLSPRCWVTAVDEPLYYLHIAQEVITCTIKAKYCTLVTKFEKMRDLITLCRWGRQLIVSDNSRGIL